MRLSVFPCRFAVLVLPSLLLCATCTDVAARTIDKRSTNDESSSPPTITAVPDNERLPETPDAAAGDDLTEVSYDATDSPTGTEAPEPETTAVTAATAEADVNDSAELNFASEDTTEETGSRWIQKIPHRRPSAKSSRSLRVPHGGGSAFKSPGNPLSTS